MMFALDTNILVYAHNLDSPLHKKAKNFIERIIADGADSEETQAVAIPLQVCAEFINVMTRLTLEHPITLLEAIGIIREYTEILEIPVINPQPAQLKTFLSLLESTSSRKKVFDLALAATLKDNNIEGIYTVNTNDFRDLNFLKVENPLDQE